MPPSGTHQNVLQAPSSKATTGLNKNKIVPAIPYALTRSLPVKPVTPKAETVAQKEQTNGIKPVERRPSILAANAAGKESRELQVTAEEGIDKLAVSSEAHTDDRLVENGASTSPTHNTKPLLIDSDGASTQQPAVARSTLPESPIKFKNGVPKHRSRNSVIQFGDSEVTSMLRQNVQSSTELTSEDGPKNGQLTPDVTREDLQPLPHSSLPDMHLNGISTPRPQYRNSRQPVLDGAFQSLPPQQQHNRSISSISNGQIPFDDLRPLQNGYEPFSPMHPDSRGYSATPNGQYGGPVAQAPVPSPWAAEMQNAEALSNHVLAGYGGLTFVDTRINIADTLTGEKHYFDGHAIILARSFTLAQRIRPSEMRQTSEIRFEADLQLNDKYLKIATLLEATRCLYGGMFPLLEPPRMPQSGQDETIFNEWRLKSALQYIATGHFIGFPAFAARGVDLAASALHWTTVPLALNFTTHGHSVHNVGSSDVGSDVTSSSSSDGLSMKHDSGVSALYEPFASELSQRVIRFMVHTFPYDFYLDSSAGIAAAPVSPNPISATEQINTGNHNRRLSNIRFGDASIKSRRPTHINTHVSSVLLSLPFSLLSRVLEHDELAARLGSDTVSSIMRQIVAERETRRRRTMNSNATTPVNGTDLSPVGEWRELVEPSRARLAGSRLVRRRREVDTPVSSGGQSE